ncbi:DUF4267 domain-containing protein [Amycolatopsis rubida]|uniref:DUF4267 domain-containing protein n=1 Tax=Amycolatopsis rubida TaxID=112413 RepID=A0A1I6B1R3_9PSEU|nr:DUF4267 domain-containing protein [Amycolatopsis rubida]MYW89366.1 DUF4267 domain-containing protein [Amycolatopsis rubida]NEC54343.1 DUF4267 domain-containing protein [Amycolatopsis rubida]SFQ74727.1 protein of unknown function [Amycolatopsis rubida]
MLITAYVLAAIPVLGIIYVGFAYLFAPAKTAATFGLREIPAGSTAFFEIKGNRDLGTGLILGVAMLAGSAHLAGWLLLAATVMPVCDMLIILRHKGKKSAAYGVHGATAAFMAATSVLFLLG